jgi:hypothetical protein
MAASIGGVGRVTVSLRKSIIMSPCASMDVSLMQPAPAPARRFDAAVQQHWRVAYCAF